MRVSELREQLNNKMIYLGMNCPKWIAKTDSSRVFTIEPTKAGLHKALEETVDFTGYLIIDSQKLDKWCEILEAEGLRYAEDYLDEFVASRLYAEASKKKLAVMYGNCQMHDYYDSVNMSEEFRMNYESVYFKYLEYPRWKENRLDILLEICDLLVLTKEGFDEKFRNVQRYVSKRNPGCRCIQIPTYSFRGYFPQTNSHIQEKGEFDVVAELFNSFHREDKLINQMIKDGKTIEEIKSQVKSGKSFSADAIVKLMNISLKQLEAMDRVSDISIYPFVKENYQKIRMFKDPVHMENVLVWYAAMQILSLLGLHHKKEVPEETIHYFTQLPIYPEVRESLHLTWEENAFHPVIRLAQGMIQVSVEEFVERYYAFAHNASAIRESLIINTGKDNVKEWFKGYGE